MPATAAAPCRPSPASLVACPQFLAPEKLRGVGGILVSPEGRRFVDELTTRDKVAQASGPARWLGCHPWHAVLCCAVLCPAPPA